MKWRFLSGERSIIKRWVFQKWCYPPKVRVDHDGDFTGIICSICYEPINPIDDDLPYAATSSMSFGRSLLPFCCFKSYVVDSHINGTGNLINHLLKKCLKFPKESLDPSQQTFAFAQMKKEDGKGTNSVLTNVHFDVNGASRQALARIINVVELYFKFVEWEGFRSSMSFLQLKFPIPGRICWNLYLNEKQKLKNMLIYFRCNVDTL